MDLQLFSSLIQNLLHTEVRSFPPEGGSLKEFESRFCYDPALQPLFTAATLSQLFADVEERIIYEMQDELGVCILFFRFADRLFLVGPFVRHEYQTDKARDTLMHNGLPAAVASSVKLYYSAFPLVSFAHAGSTVTACIQAFSGAGESYTICRIDETQWREKPTKRGYEQTLDYSSIYRRYDMENRFLRLIQEGDTERVIIAYNEMTMQGMGSKRYINAVYQNPVIALSMVRVLARKAAEQGGASIIEINEITQRSTQKLVVSCDITEQTENTKAMILELTEAVRRHKQQSDSYSPPIQQVVNHLRLNYSQEISLTHLADLAHFSQAYLSRQFKKEVKLTITDFVSRLRCSEAARLLRESNATVQDIGAYVGYSDNNYFSKVFKRNYGVSPTDYRAGKRASGERDPIVP